MTTEARKLGGDLFAFLRELCREHEIATRVVVSRDQADQAALWWLTGDRRRPPELPLFTGWRDELAGEAAREWLATADTGSAQRTLAL